MVAIVGEHDLPLEYRVSAEGELRFPFLEVFDAPDSNLSCPIREGSTTAPQSLTLLNADEVMLAQQLLSIPACPLGSASG